MTGVLATAVGVCVVAVLALCYAVLRLHLKVETVARAVESVPTQQANPAPTPTPHAEPADAGAAAESVDDPVALITDISAARPEELPVSRIASVTLAVPLIKVTALASGLRRALDEESRMRIAHAVHRELKQQRRLRRRRSTRRAPSQGWRL